MTLVPRSRAWCRRGGESRVPVSPRAVRVDAGAARVSDAPNGRREAAVPVRQRLRAPWTLHGESSGTSLFVVSLKFPRLWETCFFCSLRQVDLVAQGDSVYDIIDASDHLITRTNLSTSASLEMGKTECMHQMQMLAFSSSTAPAHLFQTSTLCRSLVPLPFQHVQVREEAEHGQQAGPDPSSPSLPAPRREFLLDLQPHLGVFLLSSRSPPHPLWPRDRKGIHLRTSPGRRQPVPGLLPLAARSGPEAAERPGQVSSHSAPPAAFMRPHLLSR